MTKLSGSLCSFEAHLNFTKLIGLRILLRGWGFPAMEQPSLRFFGTLTLRPRFTLPVRQIRRPRLSISSSFAVACALKSSSSAQLRPSSSTLQLQVHLCRFQWLHQPLLLKDDNQSSSWLIIHLEPHQSYPIRPLKYFTPAPSAIGMFSSFMVTLHRSMK